MKFFQKCQRRICQNDEKYTELTNTHFEKTDSLCPEITNYVCSLQKAKQEIEQSQKTQKSLDQLNEKLEDIVKRHWHIAFKILSDPQNSIADKKRIGPDKLCQISHIFI